MHLGRSGFFVWSQMNPYPELNDSHLSIGATSPGDSQKGSQPNAQPAVRHLRKIRRAVSEFPRLPKNPALSRIRSDGALLRHIDS